MLDVCAKRGGIPRIFYSSSAHPVNTVSEEMVTTRKNFLFYLTFHVARYAFPLVVTPFLAHYLMKDGFGQYAVINSCVWSTVIFMDFGFYMYGINRIAHAETMDEVSREASAVVSAKLTLIPLCLIAYTILVASSGMLVRNPVATAIGALLAVGIGADFSWYFQGRQRGGTAVMIAGIPQLGQLALYCSRPVSGRPMARHTHSGINVNLVAYAFDPARPA